jgi:purine-binding chemotaxis protein CheW
VLALVFPLGAESYALPLEQVKEVVPAPLLTALPTAPPFVLGLVNLRGDVLPVLSAGVLLGSPFRVEAAYVMVVDAGGRPVGLAISGLPRIVHLALEPGAPDVHTVDGEPVVMTDTGVLVRRPVEEA